MRLPLVGSASTVRAETPPHLSVSKGGMRILVVDDNSDSAKVLALLLRTQSYEVATAFCGMTAVETALQFKPHVVLLDIGLPGLDGYQVAQPLREQAELQGVVLVAVTGYGQPEDKLRSREAGFDYHIVKPVGLEELRRTLDAVHAG